MVDAFAPKAGGNVAFEAPVAPTQAAPTLFEGLTEAVVGVGSVFAKAQATERKRASSSSGSSDEPDEVIQYVTRNHEKIEQARKQVGGRRGDQVASRMWGELYRRLGGAGIVLDSGQRQAVEGLTGQSYKALTIDPAEAQEEALSKNAAVQSELLSMLGDGVDVTQMDRGQALEFAAKRIRTKQLRDEVLKDKLDELNLAQKELTLTKTGEEIAGRRLQNATSQITLKRRNIEEQFKTSVMPEIRSQYVDVINENVGAFLGAVQQGRPLSIDNIRAARTAMLAGFAGIDQQRSGWVTNEMYAPISKLKEDALKIVDLVEEINSSPAQADKLNRQVAEVFSGIAANSSNPQEALTAKALASNALGGRAASVLANASPLSVVTVMSKVRDAGPEVMALLKDPTGVVQQGASAVGAGGSRLPDLVPAQVQSSVAEMSKEPEKMLALADGMFDMLEFSSLSEDVDRYATTTFYLASAYGMLDDNSRFSSQFNSKVSSPVFIDNLSRMYSKNSAALEGPVKALIEGVGTYVVKEGIVAAQHEKDALVKEGVPVLGSVASSFAGNNGKKAFDIVWSPESQTYSVSNFNAFGDPAGLQAFRDAVATHYSGDYTAAIADGFKQIASSSNIPAAGDTAGLKVFEDSLKASKFLGTHTNPEAFKTAYDARKSASQLTNALKTIREKTIGQVQATEKPVEVTQEEQAAEDINWPEVKQNAKESLFERESKGSGGYSATNTAVRPDGSQEQVVGKYQFTKGRLTDYNKATDSSVSLEDVGQDTPESRETQERVADWHVNDIVEYIERNGLDEFVGQTKHGAEVTPEGMIRVAHLGGKGGLKKFLTQENYNPSDKSVGTANRTSLADYMSG